MQYQQRRSLTQPVMLTVIAFIIASAGISIPFLMLLTFIWEVPLILVGYMYGFKKMLMSLFIFSIFLMISFTPAMTLPFILGGVPLIIVMSMCFHYQLSPSKMVIFSLLASLLGYMLSILCSFIALGFNPLTQGLVASDETIHKLILSVLGSGASNAEISQVTQEVQTLLNLFQRLIPSIIICSALILFLFNYRVTAIIIKRLYLGIFPELPNLAYWHFPRFCALLLGFAYVGQYWGDKWQNEPLSVIAANVVVLMTIIGYIQALAVVYYLFQYKKWPRSAYMVVAISSIFFINIFASIGIFDMFFNYRQKLGPLDS